MQYYKIYLLDAAGDIARAHEVKCSDDLDALGWAERSAGRDRVEVWQGSRLVARVKPDNAPLDSRDRYSL